MNQFKKSFSETSLEVFHDESQGKLIHPGEYGTYREAIVRDFLRFIVPCSLDISTGFLITSMDNVSTQCDVVIFDSNMTPVYEESDRQRFFPIESVHAIAEVKSTLSKKQFVEAINKLARNKALSERMDSRPVIVKKSISGGYDPRNCPYDVIPSFLICQKLDFNISNIENELDGYYNYEVEYRHRHNMILSLEDGLLLYCVEDGKSFPYSSARGINLKNRFIFSGDNDYCQFKVFAAFIFMITTSKTLFFPDIVNYMGSVEGSFQRDQS